VDSLIFANCNLQHVMSEKSRELYIEQQKEKALHMTKSF